MIGVFAGNSGWGEGEEDEQKRLGDWGAVVGTMIFVMDIVCTMLFVI